MKEFEKTMHILRSRVGSLQSSDLDSLKGRAVQAALKDWMTDLTTVRKVMRALDSNENKKVMNDMIIKVESGLAFLRVLTKHTPTFTEMDKAYTDIVGTGLTISPKLIMQHRLKHIQTLAGANDFAGVLDIIYGLDSVKDDEERDGAVCEALGQVMRPFLPTKGSPENAGCLATSWH